MTQVLTEPNPQADRLTVSNSVSENLVLSSAISRKLENIEKNGIPGMDFVTCAICGMRGKLLTTHVHRVHELTTNEYRSKFPGKKLVADSTTKRKNQHLSEVNLKFWASETGRQILKDNNEKRINTNLKKYGMKSPNVWKAIAAAKQAAQNPDHQRIAMEKRCETNLKKYGVGNLFQDPERQKEYQAKSRATIRKKYGVEFAGQIPGIQEKGRKSRSCQQNRQEKLLQTLLPDHVQFTGNGKFWLHWQDGSPKNPDFVVRPFKRTRAVIELFGEFFHPVEHQALYEREYAKIGVKCLVVWSKELSSKSSQQRLIKDRILPFLLSLGSSETTRRNPHKG